MLKSRTNWTMLAAFVAVAGLLAAGAVQTQGTAQTPPPPSAKKAPAATTAPAPPAAAAQKAPPAPQGAPPPPPVPAGRPVNRMGPGMGPMGQGQGPGQGQGSGQMDMGPMGMGPMGMGPMQQGQMGMGPMHQGQMGMGPMQRRRMIMAQRRQGRMVGNAMWRGRQMRQQMMQRAPIGMMLNRLDLTQAQKDQLKGFRDQQQKDMAAAREGAKTARQKLQEAMRADVPDEAAVRAAGVAVATAQAETMVLQARAKGQLMKMLTPEQKQKMAGLGRR